MEKVSRKGSIKGGISKCYFCNLSYVANANRQLYCSSDCRLRARYEYSTDKRPDDSIELVYIHRVLTKQADAKSRGLEFDLTAEFVKQTLSSACRYCNGPSTVLERYDNNIGYIESNVVPSCSICNSLKGKLHGDMFTVLRQPPSLKWLRCVIIGDGMLRDVETGEVYVKQQKLSG